MDRAEKMIRIGQGYDVHRLIEGRRQPPILKDGQALEGVILGGVCIPYSKYLKGHSDADVLLHAIADALLGAAAMGDIGKHFPDNDPLYEGADSLELLKEVNRMLLKAGYTVINVDSTVIAQKPKLMPYIDDMRRNIAGALKIDMGSVSVKATTEEGLGFTGNGEGIAAQAVCLISET